MVKVQMAFLRVFKGSVIPAKAGIQKRGSPIGAFPPDSVGGSVQSFVADGDDKINGVGANLLLAVLVCCFLFAGCSPTPAQIPGIPKDHPANKFYQAAQQGMLSDKVCLDNSGDPSIPIGKIKKGEEYVKLGDLSAGVFRFRENATGKQYLGVSFFQYSGFLQIPKVCVWEEKNRE